MTRSKRIWQQIVRCVKPPRKAASATTDTGIGKIWSTSPRQHRKSARKARYSVMRYKFPTEPSTIIFSGTSGTWYANRREKLRIKIQQIYDESKQIFGAGKITAVMEKEGYKGSQEMVRELMQDMGLLSIRQDAKKVYDKERRSLKNHLNQFEVQQPNEAWVSDFSYFLCKDIKYYICAIIDLYAMRIVGYRVGKRNSTPTCKKYIQTSIRIPQAYRASATYRPRKQSSLLCHVLVS